MIPLALTPLDTLFFRDARPMGAGSGSGGHGANWPLPTVAHEALRAGLLRLAGEERTGKERRGHDGANIVTEAFRSLRTRGPFPMRAGSVYLPCPADVVLDDEGIARLVPSERIGDSDLPAGLLPLAPSRRIGKPKPMEWIPEADFRALLSGAAATIHAPEPLMHAEHRMGIAINDETGTVEDGKLYSAEHLRLAEGVSLWMETELSSRKASENRGRSLDDLDGQTITLGGEGRMVRISRATSTLSIPKPSGALCIKWVLSTHAVFTGGWRPDWIDPNSLRVLLRGGDSIRRPGENRLVWRERVRSLPIIGATLVAVCNRKPIYFSGWDIGEQGPKPTLAAIPAGSVYFFRADDAEQASRLVDALHGRTRSDYFGEKGMGLGYCGVGQDVVGRPDDGKRKTEDGKGES